MHETHTTTDKELTKTVVLNEHHKDEYAPAHSAEHLLNQTMIRMFGCERSKNAHIERKKSKINYNLAQCPTQEQIAQIEKECVVYNDLHHYQVFAEDENAGLISLIFSMYMYINACYKPGVKASKSCSKTISVTKDPCLLEKYDPDFKSKIQM